MDDFQLEQIHEVTDEVALTQQQVTSLHGLHVAQQAVLVAQHVQWGLSSDGPGGGHLFMVYLVQEVDGLPDQKYLLRPVHVMKNRTVDFCTVYLSCHSWSTLSVGSDATKNTCNQMSLVNMLRNVLIKSIFLSWLANTYNPMR